jgi:uncharacterized membrane protein
MESRAKILGHPIHPMLIVFPLGLLITAVIFDIVYFITDNPTFAIVSFWMIAAGIVGGLLAAVFGLWDWLAIPRNTRARRVGMWHGIGNLAVLILFAISWFIRLGNPDYVPTILAFIPAAVAVLIGAVTAWLGGELVDRLGVGVDPGAHLNAPSSLSGRPADAGARRSTDVGAGRPSDVAARRPADRRQRRRK